MSNEIKYLISNYPSKYAGYHGKNKENHYVKAFLPTIWKNNSNFEDFLDDLCYIFLLERICLERGFQKIRMKNRCKPICKIEKYAFAMYLSIQDYTSGDLFLISEIYEREFRERLD